MVVRPGIVPARCRAGVRPRKGGQRQGAAAKAGLAREARVARLPAMQKAREKAWRLLVSSAPLSVACAGALACYSMDPPPQSPQTDYLATPAPGSSAAAANAADPASIAP